MRKQNSSFIIKAIILLLSMIIMIFVACLAWFIPPDHPVTANGLSVKANSDLGFRIAVGFETNLTRGYVMSKFDHTFDLRNLSAKTVDSNVQNATYNDYDIFKDYAARDLTGNGTTLVRPTMKSKNSGIDTTVATYTEAVPNRDYISFDLYVESKKQGKLYLDEKSIAISKAESEGKALVTDDDVISPDAIVGALRVAFTDYVGDANDDDRPNLYLEDDNYNELLSKIDSPIALWIPCPDIRYDDTNKSEPKLLTDINDHEDPNATFVSDGQQMNTYYHHYFHYPGNGNMGSYVRYDEAFTKTITGFSKEDIVICNIDYKKDNGMYYGKARVNIWLEGCDSEARRAMAGGEFKLDFEFTIK